MKLRTIKDIDFTDKRVLVRTDYNVALDAKGNARDRYKIEASKGTIEHILSFSGAKVAILSHLGRPGGKKDDRFLMGQLKDEVQAVLGCTVRVACDSVGVCVSGALESIGENEVILLENVRFHAKEKEDDEHFARLLAAPFDIYINDAFAVAHRAHASVHAITEFLPSYAGLWLQREVEILTKMREEVESPAVAVIGGSKIETKIPLISEFEKTYDTILVGGRTAVEAVDAKMTFSEKVILPEAFAGEERFDISKETTKKFVEVIQNAKTIVWNGPLGKFEEKPYDRGTKKVAKAIAKNKQAFSVVGGGESVQAITQTGHFKDISFVSTGGGAMLAYLSRAKMPALEALEE